ncbi:hypothetical protein [uncultured Methanobrevibacter sp.]|uniref:hypothetical protein n=1 Tax=uncultured Methanobrevibacter sp. TaxID=253161 RepID=UPI0025DBDD9D|nr:hypothetical protein [uncultured Methanobrevibacter sp.]
MAVKSYKQFTEEKKQKNKPVGTALKKSPEVSNIEKDTEDEEKKYVNTHADKCPRCGQDAEHCTCDEDPWSTNVMFRAPHGKIEKETPKQDFKKEKKKQ